MIWQEFEDVAPELARLGRERFERRGVALLGTLRKDGSPRISPVEPFFVEGHVLLGVMARSGKARDLRRDPRCAVHSAVPDSTGAEGEFKLHGRVEEMSDPRLRDSAGEAWWVSRPAEDARVFSLDIEQAVFIGWDTAAGTMTVTRWSPDRGVTSKMHPYP